MRNLAIVGLSLALCQSALAQPPSTPPPPQPTNGPLRLTLDEAMQRARANSPQILSANINALLAREDTVQAKAALLPTVSTLNQYIYTQQHNGELVFVSNDGTHVYNNQLMVHGDLYAPQKLAEWRVSQVAEAVARFKSEIALRGLGAIVVTNYYGMVVAERKACFHEPDCLT